MEKLKENFEMNNTVQIPTKEAAVRLAYRTQRLVKDPRAFFEYLDCVTVRVESHNIRLLIQHQMLSSVIFPERIASISDIVMAAV